MRYTPLREQLRAARGRAGLSQAGLAQSSATSRVTIARFESGSAQDLRIGTLSRLCEALGLELTAEVPGAVQTLETQLLRERERASRLDRRRRHAALAVRLLSAAPPDAEALVAQARAAVDRWEREQLCSRHYISRWRRKLTGPMAKVALALLDDGAWADALLQNSPWTFALEPAA